MTPWPITRWQATLEAYNYYRVRSLPVAGLHAGRQLVCEAASARIMLMMFREHRRELETTK